MSLFEEWQTLAYNQNQNQATLQSFWQNYFLEEKAIYEQLLATPDTAVEGTVKELAEKYNMDILHMVGFLDGINESLVKENPLEKLKEDTKVSLAFDKEKLYMNMVDAKADWLYDLEAWDEIFDEAKKKELYKQAKNLHTIKGVVKIGRNDPCPCGSGKKYKQCCMKKQA